MKTTTQTSPALYVGTYAKYNAGSIAGAWLQLEDYSSQDEFVEAAEALHADETDPEIMYQDFEGFPRCWYSESCAPPKIAWEWLELDETERAAFGLYADNIGDGATIEDFREAYQGTPDSVADFAQQTAEDCGEIPANLPIWIVIDWQASWDQNLCYDYWSDHDDNGTLHIFRNI